MKHVASILDCRLRFAVLLGLLVLASPKAVAQVPGVPKVPEAAGKAADKAEAAQKSAAKAGAAQKAAEKTAVAEKAAEKAQVAQKAAEKAQVAQKAAEKPQAVQKVAERAQAAQKSAEKAQAAQKAAEKAQVAQKSADKAQVAQKAAEKAQVAQKAAEKAAVAQKSAEKAAVAQKAADKAAVAQKAEAKAQAAQKAAEKAQVAQKASEKSAAAERSALAQKSAEKAAAAQKSSKKAETAQKSADKAAKASEKIVAADKASAAQKAAEKALAGRFAPENASSNRGSSPGSSPDRRPPGNSRSERAGSNAQIVEKAAAQAAAKKSQESKAAARAAIETRGKSGGLTTDQTIRQGVANANEDNPRAVSGVKTDQPKEVKDVFSRLFGRKDRVTKNPENKEASTATGLVPVIDHPKTPDLRVEGVDRTKRPEFNQGLDNEPDNAEVAEAAGQVGGNPLKRTSGGGIGGPLGEAAGRDTTKGAPRGGAAGSGLVSYEPPKGYKVTQITTDPRTKITYVMLDGGKKGDRVQAIKDDEVIGDQHVDYNDSSVWGEGLLSDASDAAHRNNVAKERRKDKVVNGGIILDSGSSPVPQPDEKDKTTPKPTPQPTPKKEDKKKTTLPPGEGRSERDYLGSLNSNTPIGQQLRQAGSGKPRSKGGGGDVTPVNNDGMGVNGAAKLTPEQMRRLERRQKNNMIGNAGAAGGLRERGGPRSGPDYGKSTGLGSINPGSDGSVTTSGGRQESESEFFDNKPKTGLPRQGQGSGSTNSSTTSSAGGKDKGKGNR